MLINVTKKYWVKKYLTPKSIYKFPLIWNARIGKISEGEEIIIMVALGLME